MSISTDEELILAIGGLQSTVFKLYLKKAEQPQQHPRVCDGCQQDIVGVRFKCLTCIDYDLCSSE